MKIGDKVLLNPSYAKWHLENPDIYEVNGNLDQFYEPETLLHLACCLGEPVHGTVIGYNPSFKCWNVTFKCGPLKATYWCEKHHLILS